MKIRTLLGLTIIGSAAYAHKRNGGKFNLESMKRSLQDLWTGFRGEISDAKSELTHKSTTSASGVKDALGPVATRPAGSAIPGNGAGR